MIDRKQIEEEVERAIRREAEGLTPERAKEIWHGFQRYKLRNNKATFASYAANDDSLGRPNRAAAEKLKAEIFALLRPAAQTEADGPDETIKGFDAWKRRVLEIDPDASIERTWGVSGGEQGYTAKDVGYYDLGKDVGYIRVEFFKRQKFGYKRPGAAAPAKKTGITPRQTPPSGKGPDGKPLKRESGIESTIFGPEAEVAPSYTSPSGLESVTGRVWYDSAEKVKAYMRQRQKEWKAAGFVPGKLDGERAYISPEHGGITYSVGDYDSGWRPNAPRTPAKYGGSITWWPGDKQSTNKTAPSGPDDAASPYWKGKEPKGEAGEKKVSVSVSWGFDRAYQAKRLPGAMKFARLLRQAALPYDDEYLRGITVFGDPKDPEGYVGVMSRLGVDPSEPYQVTRWVFGTWDGKDHAEGMKTFTAVPWEDWKGKQDEDADIDTEVEAAIRKEAGSDEEWLKSNGWKPKGKRNGNQLWASPAAGEYRLLQLSSGKFMVVGMKASGGVLVSGTAEEMAASAVAWNEKDPSGEMLEPDYKAKRDARVAASPDRIELGPKPDWMDESDYEWASTFKGITSIYGSNKATYANYLCGYLRKRGYKLDNAKKPAIAKMCGVDPLEFTMSGAWDPAWPSPKRGAGE